MNYELLSLICLFLDCIHSDKKVRALYTQSAALCLTRYFALVTVKACSAGPSVRRCPCTLLPLCPSSAV